jgi:Do/DeqQ family serine protease
MKKTAITIALGLISGMIGAYLIIQIEKEHLINSAPEVSEVPLPLRQAAKTEEQNSFHGTLSPPSENFVEASEKSRNSVVFIETLNEVEYRMGGWMDWFFEPRSSQRVGSGSGVVFSEDGYIVTNNHVISDADEITVITGKRSYNAELIGRDPSSDLAVIKINSEDLPAISKGNSEEVKVGEWVLAVGNPFNLTSTVTAGIVSAKGRNINILRDRFPIESFIQTDAAINPGNSGGALVNSNGELIGINTAILSRTGSYAGYGFAIPVNIVKKVFNDIVKYGEVQKAFLGAEYIDIDVDISNRLKIEDLDGVLITQIQENGAADKAGLRERDVIRKINGIQIHSRASIEELLGKSYPGDTFSIVVERDQKMITKELRLTNTNGGYGIIKREIFDSEDLDASFEKLSLIEKESMGITSGIKVVDFEKNGVFASLGIPEGFIITQINNKEINEPEEFEKIMLNIRGRFDIIGIDKRGKRVYFPFRR